MTSRLCKSRVTANMDFKGPLFQCFVVGTCLSTFVSAHEAPEPSSSPASSSSSSSLCSRALASTLWGAAFAFVSLLVDAWLAAKAFALMTHHHRPNLADLWGFCCSLAERLWFPRSLVYWPSLPERLPSRHSGGDMLGRVVTFLVISPLTPLFGVQRIFFTMFVTFRFRHILRRPTNPISNSNLRRVRDDTQPPTFLECTRLVASYFVVLGMRDSTKVPDTHIYRNLTINDENVADALTLGHKLDENSCLVRLTRAGKLALLKSSILEPNYKQLRFLDSRSRLAAVIIGVQAIGYITSVVYRAAKGLPVSPIEILGFACSMLVLVHSAIHDLAVLSQTPLVIYLNPQREAEFIDKCDSTRWLENDDTTCGIAAAVGMMVVANVVVALTILVGWHVLKLSWLDAIGPILLLLSLIMQAWTQLILTFANKLAGPGLTRVLKLPFFGCNVKFVFME